MVSSSHVHAGSPLNVPLEGLYSGIVTVALWAICMPITIPDGIRQVLIFHYRLFSQAVTQYIPVYDHHHALCSLDDNIRN